MSDPIIVHAPIAGSVMPLRSLEDSAFSQGVLGPGLAISPTGNEVRSPITGVVQYAYPSGHAYIIRWEHPDLRDVHFDVLVHIGLNTAGLGLEYFQPMRKRGDVVIAGSILGRFNLEKLESERIDVQTPVVVTPSERVASVKAAEGLKQHSRVELADPLLVVTLREV